MSLDRLITRIDELHNPSVVGLDTKLEYVPHDFQDPFFVKEGKTLEAAAHIILAYNQAIIDAICDIVPAVKPQAAYYELYGWPGMRTLAETIQYAQHKGMFVITDGKRNDIGATMTAYAAAHLGTIDVGGITQTPFGADALTVNGYLGTDGIEPLLDICQAKDKGIFVLAKTSNPSSGEVQDQTIHGTPIYAVMGNLCENWGKDQIGQYGYSTVGAVVGATYPEQLIELRKSLPHTMFLVPGYGAQGGNAKDVANAFDTQGRGAIVNSSRAILCAWKKEQNLENINFADAARKEALRMREDITSYI